MQFVNIRLPRIDIIMLGKQKVKYRFKNGLAGGEKMGNSVERRNAFAEFRYYVDKQLKGARARFAHEVQEVYCKNHADEDNNISCYDCGWVSVCPRRNLDRGFKFCRYFLFEQQ